MIDGVRVGSAYVCKDRCSYVSVEQSAAAAGVDRFFCQAEDGIRDLVRSRGLGDVYKRQMSIKTRSTMSPICSMLMVKLMMSVQRRPSSSLRACLLYTSDAADERSSVDLGGRRIIKKKKRAKYQACAQAMYHTSYTIQYHLSVRTN